MGRRGGGAEGERRRERERPARAAIGQLQPGGEGGGRATPSARLRAASGARARPLGLRGNFGAGGWGKPAGSISSVVPRPKKGLQVREGHLPLTWARVCGSLTSEHRSKPVDSWVRTRLQGPPSAWPGSASCGGASENREHGACPQH